MLNVEIRLKKILFCFWWAYNFETNKLWTVSSHSCCHIVVNHYRIICFGTHFSFLLTSEAECLQTVSVWDVRACFLFLLSPKFKKSNHESFSLTAVFLFIYLSSQSLFCSRLTVIMYIRKNLRNLTIPYEQHLANVGRKNSLLTGTNLQQSQDHGEATTGRNWFWGEGKA